MATKKPVKKNVAPKSGAKKSPAKPSAKPAAKSGSGSAQERRLLEMREDILRLVTSKEELDVAEHDVGDEADAATQSAERELLFELSDNERQKLDAIEAALRKVKAGTYGLCEACQEKIAPARIEALPQARYCIKCQSRFDAPRG